MKGLKTAVFACALALLLAACESPMRYLQYTGKDATSVPYGSWPTGPGAMAETRYTVPVYRGWPEKSYRVLGSITFEDRNAEWDEGIIDMAVTEARKRQADAIIIRRGAEYGVSKIVGFGRDANAVGQPYRTTALVIRWLSDTEIAERQRVLNEFLNNLASVGTLFLPNRTVEEQVLVLTIQQGHPLASDAARTSFTETMQKLVAKDPSNLSGTWVFKSILVTGSAISGDDESIGNGLATVNVNGDKVTIVSSLGTPELNFSGTLSQGTVSGQLGLGNSTTKCEGVATPDKISISFQSRTSDGVTRGNVVLQRLLQAPPANEKGNLTPARSRT